MKIPHQFLPCFIQKALGNTLANKAVVSLKTAKVTIYNFI